MVQLSKRRIKPQAMEKMFRLLFDILGTQASRENFNLIIDGLFSPVEKIMIVKRLMIFMLICKGEEWRTIQNIVKVSLASISKCQMILRNNVEMNETMKQIITKRTMKIWIDEFFLSLFGPGTAYVDWKTAWKNKKELERRRKEIF